MNLKKIIENNYLLRRTMVSQDIEICLNNLAAESKAESKPAAKPDNDRLLPWETAAPSNTGKTHKVWSSEDNSDQ